MDLAWSLARHQPADEEEAADLARILAFVSRHADPFDRRIAEGHLTASALVVSATGERVLLLHHRKLDRWLQPGGHGDPGETSGEQVALREAHEETGLPGLTLHPGARRSRPRPGRDARPALVRLGRGGRAGARPGAATGPRQGAAPLPHRPVLTRGSQARA